MLFYDFEVFCHDWLIVAIDMDNKKTHIIHNDEEKLTQLYEENRSNIWVGFNSRRYDQYIFKGILLGMNPKEINNYIIRDGKPGWQFSNLFWNIPLNNYDVMNSIDRGLKWFEGSMGNNIFESSVPFDIDRPLTKKELENVIKYCTYDVEQTIEVFLHRQADFEAQIQLLKMFNLPLFYVSKTKVQLAARILEAHKTDYNDEFDITIPKCLKLNENAHVVDWYYEHKDYSESLTIDFEGMEVVLAWGGIHGARPKYNRKGFFLNMDVASLYPNLMINFNLHSRSCNPEKFNKIVDTRLKYKSDGDPLQAPLKIVINGTYGAMKDKFNPLYDPRQANNVCVHGQLLILDLMEKLRGECEIVQCNTDGILIRMFEYDDYEMIDDIVYEWEQRTGLKMEFKEYSKVIQKDVNNYIIVDANGNYTSKGAWVKKLSPLDNDLPIVNKAIIDYMVHGISVEKTIMECNELVQFQQIKKISNKYDYIAFEDGKPLNERCVRVFASNNKMDGGIFKKHKNKNKLDKLEGTPERCFVDNADINGIEPYMDLDKNWYIKLAESRLREFGAM